MRNTHELTENYIFRFYRCGLSIEDTGLELAPLSDDWRGWSIRKGLLITPNKWSLTPEWIISGNALIEIRAEQDRKNLSQIIKVARLISR